MVSTGSCTRQFSKWELFVVFCVKNKLIVRFEKCYKCSALPDFQWFNGLKLIDATKAEVSLQTNLRRALDIILLLKVCRQERAALRHS